MGWVGGGGGSARTVAGSNGKWKIGGRGVIARDYWWRAGRLRGGLFLGGEKERGAVALRGGWERKEVQRHL